MKKYIIILLALMSVELGFSQNLTSDIKKMNVKFSDSENLHTKIEILLYQKNSDKPLLTQYAEFKRNGQNMQYIFGDLIMIANKNYVLWINHNSKEIFCRKIDKNSKPAEAADLAKYNLDSLLNSYDSIVYHGVNAGQKHYTILNDGGEILKSDIYFDANNYTLRKAEYVYNGKIYGGSDTKVVTNYTVFNTDVEYNPALFSERPYVRIQGGKLVLTPTYADYKLVENRSPEDEF